MWTLFRFGRPLTSKTKYLLTSDGHRAWDDGGYPWEMGSTKFVPWVDGTCA